MPVLQPAELWKQSGPLRDRRAVQAEGPPRRRAGARDDARGGAHLPHRARGPLLPRPAEAALPLPDQGARRAAAARRPAAHARVHHEGLVLASTAICDGLEASYELHIEAYDRIFDRAGLEWYRVESDVGMMGGLGAHEYMAPCAAGENDVALSDSGYAANVEVASATPQPVEGLPEALARAREVETPGAATIEAGRPAARRPARGDHQGVPDPRGGARPRAGGDPRRPPPERDQAPERARGAVPGRPRPRRCEAASAPSPASSAPSARPWTCSPTRRCGA